MPYQTWIANQLRDLGVPTEEYSGWTTRGSSSFTPGGALAHWTAGPCNATGRPSLATVVNGRADLPGPLCNVYLDRQGVAVVVAAGKANHAGDGGWRGLSGNSSVLGVEAECCNAGDWTEAQLQNYPAVLAALVAGIGRDETWVARHCDWTTRKIDTNDLSLAWLQSEAGQVLRNGGTDMPLTDDDIRRIWAAALNPSGATDSGGRVLMETRRSVTPHYQVSDARFTVKTLVDEITGPRFDAIDAALTELRDLVGNGGGNGATGSGAHSHNDG